jgi:hypothetical protein
MLTADVEQIGHDFCIPRFPGCVAAVELVKFRVVVAPEFERAVVVHGSAREREIGRAFLEVLFDFFVSGCVAGSGDV